ncbi:alpha/beta hydrolase [Brevibacillus humidisoli]|uniref:alpha/beta fold hydrolase n=1 Tax=Brevibacillus humidisoli TaxID=2895522 RepID=UPI001E64FC41|nr:alpha/beta hydrolase [Brevibacillus humidisoli]UFJ41150.1 alpha/beta hydrolase [Brevibacillus humidisoli]
MECRISDITLHYEVHGSGKPVVMLHGFSLDHRVMTGCLEPIFADRPGWKRIYLDLPGMGRTQAADWIESSNDMLAIVLKAIDQLIPEERFLVIGESYGGYLARGIVSQRMEMVDGIALICPMIVAEREMRELPPAGMVFVQDTNLLAGLDQREAAEFTSVAVVQDEYNWQRFRNEILAGSLLADAAFLERLRKQYAFSFNPDQLPVPFRKPALFLMGRQDASTGYRDAWKILEQYPRASYAVLDRAGHNLQSEQRRLFEVMVSEWLDRVEEAAAQQP